MGQEGQGQGAWEGAQGLAERLDAQGLRLGSGKKKKASGPPQISLSSLCLYPWAQLLCDVMQACHLSEPWLFFRQAGTTETAMKV